MPQATKMITAAMPAPAASDTRSRVSMEYSSRTDCSDVVDSDSDAAICVQCMDRTETSDAADAIPPRLSLSRSGPRLRRDENHQYKLLEVKVLCPISSNPDRTGYAGTYAAFANTCPAKRAEVAEKYAPAATNGHDVIPCVFEVFGGAAPEVLSLLEGWGRAARSKTPPGVEPPWSARNFMPFWSQLLSMQAQRGAAIEILNRVDGEAADREAARLRTASG